MWVEQKALQKDAETLYCRSALLHFSPSDSGLVSCCSCRGNLLAVLVRRQAEGGGGLASLYDVTACTRLQTLQHAEDAYSRLDSNYIKWSPDDMKLAIQYSPSDTRLIVGCLTRQTCSGCEVSDLQAAVRRSSKQSH